MGTIEIPYLIIYYLAPVNPRVIYAWLANGQIVVMASSQIQPYSIMKPQIASKTAVK